MVIAPSGAGIIPAGGGGAGTGIPGDEDEGGGGGQGGGGGGAGAGGAEGNSGGGGGMGIDDGVMPSPPELLPLGNVRVSVSSSIILLSSIDCLF